MHSTEAIDAAVLAHVSVYWAKVAMVALKSMDTLGLATNDENLNVVCQRIAALVEAGRIEAQGDVSRPRHSEVRAKGGG